MQQGVSFSQNLIRVSSSLGKPTFPYAFGKSFHSNAQWDKLFWLVTQPNLKIQILQFVKNKIRPSAKLGCASRSCLLNRPFG